MRPVVLLSTATAALAASLNASQEVPLFAAHEPIRLTLRAPFQRILEDRRQESQEFPGSVTIHGPDAEDVGVPVDVRTRGSTRLQRETCTFPPLRLDFSPDAVVGTVFEGQDELKLVTHCQHDRQEYQQYVLLEYLVYRTFGLLTEPAFRVRLVEITYQDDDGGGPALTSAAFLIEDDETLAARTGWRALELPALPLPAADTASVALVETFQFFIGNTDFSVFAPDPGDDECCHNVLLVGDPAGPVFAVPYDFDLSGAVNAGYANRLYRRNLRRLGIGSVRERLYRGWCGSRPYLPAVLQRFREQRPAIYGLYRAQAGLRPDVLAETIAFYDAFYEIIDDERATEREIHDHCRPVISATP